MSILQEYEEHSKWVGKETVDAISKYIQYLNGKGIDISYSDIIYKKTEWQKFEIWHKRVYNISHGKSSKGD